MKRCFHRHCWPSNGSSSYPCCARPCGSLLWVERIRLRVSLFPRIHNLASGFEGHRFERTQPSFFSRSFIFSPTYQSWSIKKPSCPRRSCQVSLSFGVTVRGCQTRSMYCKEKSEAPVISVLYAIRWHFNKHIRLHNAALFSLSICSPSSVPGDAGWGSFLTLW